MSADVQGICPACGHRSLFLASGGYVTCRILECPRPTAVADILDLASPAHIVKLEARTFSVVHPLIERLGDHPDDAALLRCDLGQRLAESAGPPRQHGTYRVHDWSRWDLVEWAMS